MIDSIERKFGAAIAERCREFYASPRGADVESVQLILKKTVDIAHALFGALDWMDGFEGAFFEAACWNTLESFAKTKKEKAELVAYFDDERFPTVAQATSLPMYKDIEAVRAYGVFGIGDAAKVLNDDEGDIFSAEDLLTNEYGPTALAKKLPSEWVIGTPLQQILEAAEARAAIDDVSGAQSVSVIGLAALAGIEHKTLQNILSPSSRSGLRKIGTVPDKGRVRTVDAKRWLATQKGFRPTISPGDKPTDTSLSKQGPTVVDAKQIRFVPVAKDGSRFDSSLEVDGAYWIGEKGNEEHFRSYDAALKALQYMYRPTWRRLDSAGRTRFIAGVTWERVDTSELGLK